MYQYVSAHHLLADLEEFYEKISSSCCIVDAAAASMLSIVNIPPKINMKIIFLCTKKSVFLQEYSIMNKQLKFKKVKFK